MPQIIPADSMEGLEELSGLCHGSREPVFLTKNGCGDLAVMSMEVYERLVPGDPGEMSRWLECLEEGILGLGNLPVHGHEKQTAVTRTAGVGSWK